MYAYNPLNALTPALLSFLPLYTACLALGLHMLHESDKRELGYTKEEGKMLPTLWWELGYAAMESADWMRVQNIACLQAIM